ncbi:MAG TPA: hypothetical protein VGX76_04355 [Pirellulales bacterium]|jgi:hypothetical protein|nr:hypothetical protein [Pirellulales bacterium]
MASSENQGLQIALIIFVMLTIILSVTTFVFFRQYEEASIKSAKDEEVAKKAVAEAAEKTGQVTRLQQILGVPESPKIADADALWQSDLNKYVTALPEDKRNYRSALEYLYGAYQSLDDKFTAKSAQYMLLEKEKEAIETAKNKLVEDAQGKQNLAEKQRDDAMQAFNDALATKNKHEQELEAELKAKEENIESLKVEKKKEVDTVVAEKVKVETALEIVNKRLDEVDPTTGIAMPDGEIIHVNQKAGSVWINVGRDDGLRRQVTFSVVGANETVGKNQPTKGRIEVTELLGPHFSECRILGDKITDPLVTGDKIFTPLFHPGRSVGIAIVGLIDLTGDGEDDRDMVVDMIHMAGGTVDAQVDLKTDKQEGNLNINTRYLIVGKEPEDAKVGEGFTKIQREAQRLNVEIINADKFLDLVGWKNMKQTIKFGKKGNVNDVPPTQPDGGRGVAPGNVSGVFKKRKPSRNGPKSTF